MTFSLTPQEQNERLTAANTSYGVGTRSYNRSPEKREMDRQRAETTEQWQSAEHAEVEQPLMCDCLQRPHPHELSIHSRLRESPIGGEMRWPWSLRWERSEELGKDTGPPP